MDAGNIISRLEVIVDAIEYEEIDLAGVYETLVEMINDLEAASDYDADFGDIRFDDLD